MSIIALSDETFHSTVENAKTMVLVRFTASWCGPCKAQKRVFEAAADSTTQLLFAEVDVDECPKTTSKLKIKGVPTIVLFDMGRPIATWSRVFSSKEEILKSVFGE